MEAIRSGLGLILVLFLLGCIPSPPPPTTLPVSTIPTQAVGDSSPTATSTTDSLANPTATPFLTTFNGFFNCRFEPNTSSPLIVLLQGQPLTILARNREGWLYVQSVDASMPCWVYMGEIPNLNPNDIDRVPYFDSLSTPGFATFTPMVDSTSGPGNHDTPVPPGSTVGPPIVTTKPPVVITTEPPVITTEPPPITTEPPPVTTEPPPTTDYQGRECNDNHDNDRDGRTDMDDPQCSNRGDDSEGS